MDIVDRFPLYPIIFAFFIYPVFAALLLRLSPARFRMQLFAVLNLAGLGVLCVISGAKSIRARSVIPYLTVALFFFALYVGTVLFHYFAVRRCRRDGTAWPAIAFLSPILLLVYVKYLADYLNPFGGILSPVGLHRFGAFFIGLSYLAFRIVHLVQEVRNEVVEMPTLSEYIAFAFFVPTLSVGPINPYSKFIGSMRAPDRSVTPIGRSLLRMLIGMVKYIFLGSIIAQFTYKALLLDGHPHGILDLLIAIPAYALYLYCNFSGYCDLAIGSAGLLNIQVAENFDRPFTSRNFQEFWSRWHITLSSWIRDLVFTPLTKVMMRRFGIKNANHVIAAALMISFLGVGIWHGNGLNFLIFGFFQGLGLVTVHYYTAYLKKHLGRERFAAYRNNSTIRAVSTVMTFIYFSLTLFLFANTWDEIKAIHHALT